MERIVKRTCGLQAVQSAASKLLAPLLGSLTSYYPLDQFAPLPAHNSPSGAGAAAPQGVGIEPWLSSKPPGSQVRQHKPTWHQPTAQETEFAEELASTFLTEAAEQLLGLSQGQGSGQDAEGPALEQGKYPKEKLQGLLLRMEGSFMGLQSMLPDFPSPAQSPGWSQLCLSLLDIHQTRQMCCSLTLCNHVVIYRALLFVHYGLLYIDNALLEIVLLASLSESYSC